MNSPPSEHEVHGGFEVGDSLEDTIQRDSKICICPPPPLMLPFGKKIFMWKSMILPQYTTTNIFYVYETLLLTASLLSQMGMTVVVITLGAVGLVVTKVAMIARASRITNIDQIDVVKVNVQEAETISSKDEHFELGFFKVVKANPCL
ncbi:hypothetical protein L1887_36216 [Cichorium endivia]|nr:hypothetical protein L1887_36216 [Cichorium endivia]